MFDIDMAYLGHEKDRYFHGPSDFNNIKALFNISP